MSEAFSQPNTKIEIISQAAIVCGRQGFSSIDEGGAFASDADALFDTIVTAEMGSNRWRFCQAFLAMSTLTTLTPSFDGWLYYWNLPADLLMLTRIYPFVDYAVFGDQVLTRTNQSLTAIYTKAVPVSKWPPAFSRYMVLELASQLAISVTNSDRIVARIQADRMLWESRALFADGQSTVNRPIRSNPYISVRNQYSTRNGR